MFINVNRYIINLIRNDIMCCCDSTGLIFNVTINVSDRPGS